MSRRSAPVLRSGLARAAALALALGVLAGCSDDTGGTAGTADADLCATYDDAGAKAEEMKSWDPQTDDVEQMRADAEELSAELDELQAVTEGRLDTAITSLRTAIDDFLTSTRAQGQKAVDAARPAMEDARQEIEQAWSVVELVAENRCGDE